MDLKKTLFWGILAAGGLSSSYALSHRFLHDRMPFNCHEIGCMAGEPDETARRCRCGDVDILNLPCRGKAACRSPEPSCTEGHFCKAFLPDCFKDEDCKNIDMEAPPSLPDPLP
jgi:hypothetical protein